MVVSPGQGGRFELRGGPGFWPGPWCPWRPVVPAAEDRPHVERGGAGRTVVPPGCLLGCGDRGSREEVVRAQVRHTTTLHHGWKHIPQRKLTRFNMALEMVSPNLPVDPIKTRFDRP